MTQGRKQPLHERALEIIRRNPGGIEQGQLRIRLKCRADDLERAIALLYDNGKKHCAIRLVGDAQFPNAPRVEIYPAHVQIKPKRRLFEDKRPNEAPIKIWIDPTYAGTWTPPKTPHPIVIPADWQQGHWRNRGKVS